jgi:hypothetical protein
VNDTNETIIDQHSFAGGPVFRFYERHLEYSGNEWDFKAKYQDIAGPSQYFRRATSDRLAVFTLAYLLVLALVLLQTRAGQYPQYGWEGLRAVGTFAGIFIGVLIAICGSIYCLTHKDYTIVPARNGNILVVRDKQHDAIIEKLQTERLKSLRLLSAPDLANSPSEELAKLNWLRDEGAITEEEYQHLCSQIAG